MNFIEMKKLLFLFFIMLFFSCSDKDSSLLPSATYVGLYQNVPFVNVLLCDKIKDDKLDFLEKSKKVLIDYINALYVTSPVYINIDDIFLEKYNELFTYKVKYTVPYCIWISSKSKIVLVKDEYFNEYQLYAEENIF